MSKTETTSSGITFGRTTSRTQVSVRVVGADARSHADPQYNDGTNSVYPVSDYSGMNTLTRDPIYSSAAAGSVLITINSANTTQDVDACPPVRSIVGDKLTFVDRNRFYTFTFGGAGATDVAATAKFTPTASRARGEIAFEGAVANGGTVELRDADGNAVVYVFDTSVDTVDGSKNGSGQVIVGIASNARTPPLTAAAADAADFLLAVNATTGNTGNSLTLNITAESEGTLAGDPLTGTDAASRGNIIKLTQDNPGIAGNAAIKLTNTGDYVHATYFIGGRGLSPGYIHGATLTFKDVLGTRYSATCSAGTAAAASFEFSAPAVKASTVTFESTNGTIVAYEAVGDCDDIPTGESKRIDLSSTSSVQTIYYQQGPTAAQSALNLITAMSIGHGAEILTSVSDAVVALTQRVGGTNGNTTISCSTNFTNSIVNGGSYTTNTVGALADGTNLTYTQSTATKIGVSGITTTSHLAKAIKESLNEAAQYGVSSSSRSTAAGALLDIETITGDNEYVDVTMKTAGQKGNIPINGTLITDGHVRLGKTCGKIVINSIAGMSTDDAFVISDVAASPTAFDATSFTGFGGEANKEATALAIAAAITANSVVNPFLTAQASGHEIIICAKTSADVGSPCTSQGCDEPVIAIGWIPETDDCGADPCSDKPLGMVIIQDKGNKKDSGIDDQVLDDIGESGFDEGANVLDVTEAGDVGAAGTTEAVAEILADAITDKANESFIVKILPEPTKIKGGMPVSEVILQVTSTSEGDLVGGGFEDNIYVEPIYAEPTYVDGDPTFDFEITVGDDPDQPVVYETGGGNGDNGDDAPDSGENQGVDDTTKDDKAPFSQDKIYFRGGIDAPYSRRCNLLQAGSSGDYDNQNPSSVQNINPNAAGLYGFASGPLENDADYLNNLLLNRNGPYEHPMWKQIRNAEHKLARNHRANNIISVDPLGPAGTTKKSNEYFKWPGNTKSPPTMPGEDDYPHHIIIDYPSPKDILETDPSSFLPPVKLTLATPRFTCNGGVESNTRYYYEPPVVTRHSPFVYRVDDVRDLAADAETVTAVVRSTLFNGLHFFTNPEMNEIHGISDGATVDLEAGRHLRNKEVYGFFYASARELQESRNFLFREQIFPKEVNTFRTLTRQRLNYEEVRGYHENGMHRRLSHIRSFWRTNKCDRIRPYHLRPQIGNRSMLVAQTPYSSINHPWALPWHGVWNTYQKDGQYIEGWEMSHGLYSKPDLAAMQALNPLWLPVYGQPWFGSGIAVWYNSFKKEDAIIQFGDLDVPGESHPNIYGVGYAEITCSVITKAHLIHEPKIGPDFDSDGTPDFTDPTPTASVPAYEAKDWVGPNGAAADDAITKDYIINQKMDHQPYDFSLISMWPLDWPAHIATVERLPSEFTISSAGKSKFVWGEKEAHGQWTPYGGQYSRGHVCLGLAPNRLGTPYKCDGQTIDEDECNKESDPFAFGKCQDKWPTSVDWFLKGAPKPPTEPIDIIALKGLDHLTGQYRNDRDVESSPPSFRTGAAGELIYSTKPTITFYKRGPVEFDPPGYPAGNVPSKANMASDYGGILDGNDDATELLPGRFVYHWTTNRHHVMHADKVWLTDTQLGYQTSTASFQFLRHAWPYFQPLWRLDELSERAPMHNTYLEFVSDITPMSRDYSILPEFRLSLNQEEYDEVLREASEKDVPVYVLNSRKRLIRNLYKPVKHVANFLNLEGVRTKYKQEGPELNQVGEVNINVISQSAADVELPSSEQVYHYIPAGDVVETNYNQDPVVESWRTDPVSVNFYERHGHTEAGENFAKLLEQDDKAFIADKETVPSTVRLSFRAIKKLLPYKDFYPVNRTITLGAQLADVYTSSISHDPDVYERLKYTSSFTPHAEILENYPKLTTIAAAATQSFIEPLFAPGIMYNSIKSGIAVSYPLYHKPPRYYGNPNIVSDFGPYAHDTRGGTSTGRFLSSSADGASWDVSGDATVCEAAGNCGTWPHSHDPKKTISMGYGSMMGVASAMPTFLMSKHKYQMPFEALYNLDVLEGVYSNLANKLSDGNIYMVDDFFDNDRGHNVQGSLASDPHAWTTATGSATLVATDCSAGDCGVNNEKFIVYLSAWPAYAKFSFTAKASPAVPTISPNEVVIQYAWNDDEAVRATNIAAAINTHATGTAGMNPTSGKGSYFVDYWPNTGPGRSNQILTASVSGAVVTIHSAHSLSLEQQRLIQISASSGISNLEGAFKWYFGTVGLADQQSREYPTHRNTSEHAFRPHFSPTGEMAGFSHPGSYNIERRIYESSINNFLAETINFFIQKTTDGLGKYFDLRMPIAVSKPAHPTIKVERGTTYYMTVNLYMGESHVMCEGPRFADVPYIRDFASASMRGAFFGPPMEVVHRSFSDGGPSSSMTNPLSSISGATTNPGYGIYQGCGDNDFGSTCDNGLIDNITDPAYHHVTPPYFYGPSSIVMKYEATESEINIVDLVAKIRDQSLYFEEYITGLTGSDVAGYSSLRFPSSSLCPKIPTPESVSTGSVARMKIESSFDIFGGAGGHGMSTAPGVVPQLIPVQSLPEFRDSEPQTHVWAMMPKWVCPVLDFGLPGTIVRNVKNYRDFGYAITEAGMYGEHEKIYDKKIKGTVPYYDFLSGRSMWLGYGVDPYSREDLEYMKTHFTNMEKIYGLVNKDSADVDLAVLEKAGLTFAITDPTQDRASLEKKGIYFQISEAFPENYSPEISDATAFATDLDSAAAKSGYVTTRSEVFSEGVTGSLVDLLGFKDYASPMPIGKIAAKKVISEAIVAIPYFEEPWYVDMDFASPVSMKSQRRTIAGTLQEAIIPGKYFLKIDPILFENALSVLLVDHLTTPGSEENERCKKTWVDFKHALGHVEKMDLGRMIKRLIGIGTTSGDPGRVGYMLPPEFDFINNSAVSPFQMVLAPFQHTLDRVDLMHIWQNLMPDVSLRATKVKSDVILQPGVQVLSGWSPDLLGSGWAPPGSPAAAAGTDIHGPARQAFVDSNVGQFLNTTAINLVLQGKAFNGYISKNRPKTSAEYFEKLRWMVFKVKQRAAQDYGKYRERQIDVALRNQGVNRAAAGSAYLHQVDSLSTKELYGANWPYDYFSLLEKAKIDIEYEVIK